MIYLRFGIVLAAVVVGAAALPPRRERRREVVEGGVAVVVVPPILIRHRRFPLFQQIENKVSRASSNLVISLDITCLFLFFWQSYYYLHALIGLNFEPVYRFNSALLKFKSKNKNKNISSYLSKYTKSLGVILKYFI